MKIFLDTEFHDHPAFNGATCELISLGAVREDGEEFYAEALEYDWRGASDWLLKNVLPGCTGPVMSSSNLAEQFRVFCGVCPEFWAYYGTADWWLIMQLYGGFTRLPSSWPQYFNDLRTLASVRNVYSFPGQSGVEHNALHDARWNLHFYDHIMGVPPRD